MKGRSSERHASEVILTFFKVLVSTLCQNAILCDIQFSPKVMMMWYLFFIYSFAQKKPITDTKA
jgi:hypothetical protein